MLRKSLPAHLRKSVPGTGGRNVQRDAEICKLRKTGLTYIAIGKRFNLSRETVRLVVSRAERRERWAREGWVSVREMLQQRGS